MEVVRETETTVTVVLGEGMALAVTYNSSTKIPSFQLTLDPGLTGSLMEGLLGNRDGDASNDLIAEDGDILDIDTASEQEIFDFGNTCELVCIIMYISRMVDRHFPPFPFLPSLVLILLTLLFPSSSLTH